MRTPLRLQESLTVGHFFRNVVLYLMRLGLDGRAICWARTSLQKIVQAHQRVEVQVGNRADQEPVGQAIAGTVLMQDSILAWVHRNTVPKDLFRPWN